jgi:chromate reductase, NAD(P)H dehydrogenase (quinone)
VNRGQPATRCARDLRLGAQGLLQRRSRTHFAGACACGNEAARSVLIRAVPVYNFDIQNATGFPAEIVAWADAIRSADGLIIVSPEYNWSIPGGLKNAIDWVSRMKDQPFKDKPVALQSAAGGILGGSRMQYHLRQSLTSIDALLFGRPEVIVTFAAQKFDEKTLELKDQTAIDMIKLQLSGFDKFIRRVSAKD